MAIIYDEILSKGIRAGQIPAKEEQARNWYREAAKKFKTIDERKLMRADLDRIRSQPKIGHMYMFYYDAKHKETLPYFDRFPMIFPYKKVKGGS
jgi:outer membrane protein assembly factor BamD (BamD/ComL family)